MPTYQQSAVESLLLRHRAFWERGQTAQPLLRVDPSDDIIYPLRTTHLPPPGRPVTLDDVSLDAFWHRYAQLRLIPPGASVFQFAYPYAGFPWMEAMIGCQVEATSDGANIWVRHWSNPDWDQLLAIEVADDNPWFQRLLELTQEMVRRSEGRYVVTPGHQGGLPHGPSDMLSAVLGNERMCYELYDNPDKVERFLLRMTEIWIRVVGKIIERIPSFHGGYVNGYGIWAPGPAPVWVEDAMLFFSPRNYRRFLLPCDQMAFAAFPYVGMHAHSGAAHLLDDLLAQEGLRAVQFAWDSSGPPLDELLAHCRRIQERKPLILCGRFNEVEQEKVLATLSLAGFCFQPRLV